jgi:hypothetical protein
MPCVASRRAAINAAVEAHNRTHPAVRLPRPAARLLAVMFPTEDVCCVSQETLRAEGFGKTLRRCCAPWSGRASCRGRRVRHVSRIPTGFWRWQKCHDPSPPRDGVRSRPRRAAGTPRPASWPTRRPGAPATSSRASTRARLPAPSWRCWRRYYGGSTTPAPAAASRAMRRSPPGRSAPAARWRRR